MSLASDKLNQIHQAGLLTEAEFEGKRAEIEERATRFSKMRDAYAFGVLTQAEFQEKLQSLGGFTPSGDVSGDVEAVGDTIRSWVPSMRSLTSTARSLSTLFGDENDDEEIGE